MASEMATAGGRCIRLLLRRRSTEPLATTRRIHQHASPRNAPLPSEAVARARASVLEIRKLLLGPRKDALGSVACSRDAQVSSGTMPLAKTRFDELNLSPLTLKSLHQIFGYERLTSVQEATLSTILQGNDIVVKSEFGTGKTIAFLVPAIEAVLEAFPTNERVSDDIISLVICPTRELALQIFMQARALLQFHTDIKLKVLTGGFRISKEREALRASLCQILIATPGRLLDHLEKTDGFKQRLHNLKLLVLDEADHILDIGYRVCIENILKHLPCLRQTLLFSASMPPEIRSIAKVALNDAHRFIDMVEQSSVEQHNLKINTQIKQRCVVAPITDHLTLLYASIKEHMESNANYKIIVFCVTARITTFMFTLYKELGLNCLEIHSKKSQMHRFHTYKDFRDSDGSLVMFTSNVSSRGLDYPNITLVIQVGLPECAATYNNRIGRTGRCGKGGESLLLLTPWEDFFIEKLHEQSIQFISTPCIDTSIKAKIILAITKIDRLMLWHAYRTWLGYYTSLANVPLTKEQIVNYGNEFSAAIGYDEPPALPKSIISKMALRGVRGLTKN